MIFPLHDLSQKVDPRLLMENLRSIEREIKTTRITVTTPTPANTEFSVTHGLNLVPTGVLLVGSSAAVRIYNGATANDNLKAYLKADAAGVTITLDISGGEVKI